MNSFLFFVSREMMSHSVSATALGMYSEFKLILFKLATSGTFLRAGLLKNVHC